MLIASGTDGWIDVPLTWVAGLSLAAGVLMPLAFRYASDQRGIHVAKDKIKAHLLAVRLYPEQLSVVLHSYARIVLGTLRYLRLAMKPVLYIAAPAALLVAQADLFLGVRAFVPGEDFLFTVHTATAEQANRVTLMMPPEVSATAPAVHITADREVVWRLIAKQEGRYSLTVQLDGQRFEKSLVVSTAVRRLSTVRRRGQPWLRMIVSGERALPGDAEIVAMELSYPERNIAFAWQQWNWIWLFAVLSLVVGLIAKTVMGIEI